MSAGNKMVKAAGAIVIMNLLSRLLGFGREMAIADKFGVSTAVDAYLVAYTIPYFLQAILGAALVTAVVPIFTEYLVEKREKEAWMLVSNLLNISFAVLLLFTIMGVGFSTLLVKLTAPGFNPEATELASSLTKIMFPSVIFMGVGMLLTGILNAFHYFALPAFAPGFSSLVIIIAVIVFGSKYGITGLAVGTLVSMLGFLIIQLPILRKLGFRYSFTFDYKHPDIKRIAATIMPIVIGVAVNQIYFAINRVFASGLAEGSIAALNYAFRLMQLPLGIFVVAVSSVIFPTLSAQAIAKDYPKLKATLMRGLRLVTLIAIPAGVGLIVLAEPIVALLFERGAFDATATAMTAKALIFFSVGMFAQAANLVITRAYYAVQDVRTPFIMSLISIIVNVVLSFILIKPLTHGGLALANSLAATVNTGLLYFYLTRHLEGLPHKQLGASLLKILIASGVMAWFTLKIFTLVSGSLMIQVAIAILVGAFVYGGLIILLREEETISIIRQGLSRLKL
ncbi:MAG: murein biosynthesis integral membrane protein MurJ [Bacillota bacterium]|nr:murein biosynthesis integral membrane protein MurJ [Bacillota bacterium]